MNGETFLPSGINWCVNLLSCFFQLSGYGVTSENTEHKFRIDQQAQAHTHTHSHKHSHKCTNSHSHKHTLTQTHTHTNAHSHKHTHLHKHRVWWCTLYLY